MPSWLKAKVIDLLNFLYCVLFNEEKATTEAVLVDVRICCLCRIYTMNAFIGCNLVHTHAQMKRDCSSH